MHDDKPDLDFKPSQPGSPDLTRKPSGNYQDPDRPNFNVPDLRYDDSTHLDLASGNTSTLDLNPERTTGVEMTTFRRLSAVASAERDRFRRGSAAGSVEARERFRRASVLGRTETRIGEEGEGELGSGVRVDGDTVVDGDGDHVERGTIDGGFGWAIVACQYSFLIWYLQTTLTHAIPFAWPSTSINLKRHIHDRLSFPRLHLLLGSHPGCARRTRTREHQIIKRHRRISYLLERCWVFPRKLPARLEIQRTHD